MYCSSCGSKIPDKGKFCTQCGTAVGGATYTEEPSIANKEGRMEGNLDAREKTYRITEIKYINIINKTQTWLSNQDFEIQRFKLVGNAEVIQVRKKGEWRRFVGMSTALAIQFSYSHEEIRVEIGTSNWTDKMVTGAASMLIAWPLAATTAIGVYEQIRTPDKIFAFIDDLI